MTDICLRETQLTKRVNDWTNRLEPLLREQELAPAFDIHNCSDRLLVKMGQLVKSKTTVVEKVVDELDHSNVTTVKNAIRFNDIVAGNSRSEVSRSFLACLQLANMGNVLMIPPKSRDDKNAMTHGDFEAAFSVQLIARNQKRDVENYLAPSLVEV